MVAISSSYFRQKKLPRKICKDITICAISTYADEYTKALAFAENEIGCLVTATENLKENLTQT